MLFYRTLLNYFKSFFAKYHAPYMVVLFVQINPITTKILDSRIQRIYNTQYHLWKSRLRSFIIVLSYFGEFDYKYNGCHHEAKDLHTESYIKSIWPYLVVLYLANKYNAALVNYYPLHSDDEDWIWNDSYFVFVIDVYRGKN